MGQIPRSIERISSVYSFVTDHFGARVPS